MNKENARQRIETAFETYGRSFFLVELLGLEISYSENVCITWFPVDDFLFNPQGSYHGGLLTAIMDVTMAHLCKKLNGDAGVTMELKSLYPRPLTQGPALCKAWFTRQDRSVGFVEARVWDAKEKLVAQGTATWKMPG
jgi:uncharacterized protein (TIGR00369 family)